jgi:hypothetical protein
MDAKAMPYEKLGQSPDGYLKREPMRADAFRKCPDCGSTLMVRLDWQLHCDPHGRCIRLSRAEMGGFRDELSAIGL